MNTAKAAAARCAVALVEPGMTIGLGTGTTAQYAIEAIGERVKEGLAINAVASSLASEKEAARMGISIRPFDNITRLDLYIDGADEIDAQHNLIKGGGGALLREKILAYNSKRFVVIADETKLFQHLGAFPLPVEIVQFAWQLTFRNIERLGGKPRLRTVNDSVSITDNGNYILDCAFDSITTIEELNTKLHHIPGVVETGLFPTAMVHQVIIGKADGEVLIMQ